MTTDLEADLYVGAKFARNVDDKSRVVEVLAITYNEISNTRPKYFFKPGSIKFGYDQLSHLKLLRDHDPTQSVGYAIDYREAPEGIYVTFKIANGPEGDKSLAGFIEKNYDGLSVGVDFPNEEADFTKDKTLPGVRIVHNAVLSEVSQVSQPAFKNSRVLSAAYSRQGEAMDNENPTGAVESAPKTYTMQELKELGMLGANFVGNASNALIIEPVSVQTDPAVAPREKKDEAKSEGAVFVSEPPLYRFDGNDKTEFSSDVRAALQMHDSQAMNRVNKFLSAEFAVTKSNASTLNPTVNRQDMYVDQLDYEYPIWNTINRGTLSDVTEFKFPKFNAASGLVADHVEGTEPTLGSASFTSQTVTPKALSGKIEVNREAWDQGGTPALSTAILTAMRRAWYEGLETYAAAQLDAYSLAAGLITTLTTAAVDNALYKEVTRATAKLKFSRGGYRLTDFLAHEDLFVNLMLAEDGQDRPLFPMINPVNANGGATPRMGLTINGLALKPAWALGAAGTVAENSYLLNPEDVAGWASAPQFLEFNIQVKSIYLGIWGYAAFAVQRDEGLRRFVYDPTAP